jgi:hypothetical protein
MCSQWQPADSEYIDIEQRSTLNERCHMIEALIVVALGSSVITLLACTFARAAGRETPRPVPRSALIRKVF